ncbi:MAG: ABC transporter ATP-binding protein [Clostridia bacterium]|nr:ABC transporter ATP-binding protein [Clostridia bacterium]
MLKMEDVHTYYGNSHILQGVTLEIKEGELVSLLGRNGAGKTTIIRSIIGFARAKTGKIFLKGNEITLRPPYRIAQQGVGLVPQGRGIFPSLSVKENLTLAARKQKNGDPNRTHWDLNLVYQYFPRLKERENNKGNQLSGGEQQMLAIGRALMTNPDLLLMDEPSEGLAPLIVKEIGEIVGELRKHGMSILLVEQNLPMALSVADRVYVVNKGRIVHHCTPKEFSLEDGNLKQYLGV